MTRVGVTTTEGEEGVGGNAEIIEGDEQKKHQGEKTLANEWGTLRLFILRHIATYGKGALLIIFQGPFLTYRTSLQPETLFFLRIYLTFLV